MESKYTLKLLQFGKDRSVEFQVALTTKKVTKARAGELFKAELKKYEVLYSKKKRNWCYMILNSEGSIFGLKDMK